VQLAARQAPAFHWPTSQSHATDWRASKLPKALLPA
jgi:hypothetical protein